MYFMYVDESGDPGQYNGINNGNSKHFILSGLIIPAINWNETFDRMKIFRKLIKDNYGLSVREEIHAAELIRVNKTPAYKSIPKRDRLAILNLFAMEMPNIFQESNIINVCLDKTSVTSNLTFKELAWSRLIQRFDTFLKKAGQANGIIISDGNEDPTIRAMLRRMKVYNPGVSMFTGEKMSFPPTTNILEDIFPKDSKHSYFIQAVDVVAHLLYRKEYPKGSLQKYNIDKAFAHLKPILNLKASKGEFGIVRK